MKAAVLPYIYEAVICAPHRQFMSQQFGLEHMPFLEIRDRSDWVPLAGHPLRELLPHVTEASSGDDPRITPYEIPRS